MKTPGQIAKIVLLFQKGAKKDRPNGGGLLLNEQQESTS
jgi:hypothetical protein